MPEPKYLITRPFGGSGIGSNLLSLAGAVWLAGELERTVVVDWRGSDFLRDKSVNLFTEYLDPVDEIQGVPVLYAPTGAAGEDDAPEEAVVELRPDESHRVLADGSDVPFLVLTPFHGYERVEPGGSPLEQFRRLRDFYRRIRPGPRLHAEIESFADAHRLDDTFAVAINIGTGNGDYAKGGAFPGRVRVDIFADQERFLRKMAAARKRALRGLPRHLREAAATFVATDAGDMSDMLLRLPNAIARRRRFPPPGIGRRFADYDDPAYSDRDALTDILADHFLLARCNAIIRNPSVFPTYAVVTTTYFNGNMQNVEALYPRYRIRAARRRARSLVRI